MYREFSILSISTSLMEKKVYVEFTHDVDGDTVTLDKLVLMNKATSEILSYKIIVRRNFVELELENWPVPNTEYLLKIQKGITSIISDELPDSLQRNIIFKSEITSTIEVLSPAEHEELDDVVIRWKETQVQVSESLVNSYYLEISTNNAFYSPIRKTEVTGRTEISLTEIPVGQYYLRIRAQEGTQYGVWSEIIPFSIGSENVKPDPAYDEDDEDPIFEEDLVILYAPQSGETPKSFIFQFDEELDADSIGEIIVTRRPI